MGVPYIPVRGLAGTDVFERRDDMIMAPNPFDPDEVTVVALAQNPDVALLHATKADAEGNALLRKHGEDVMVAQASSKVIITAEEIVDRVTIDDPDGHFISTINVSAIVHAPNGAHPTAVDGYYDMDREHIQKYLECSTDDESFQRYLAQYVLGVSEQEYQERVASDRPSVAAGAR